MYYGTLGQCWVGTGIALPATLPATHRSQHPGYTPPHPGTAVHVHGRCRDQTKYAVGLISVGQLSLYAQIWEIQGMTEVYNLVRIDNPDDHKSIPQTK